MSERKKIKVLIIDDSLLVRNIIADILDHEKDIEVVATGKTGIDCIELAKKLKPDLIVLDIEMPIMDGLTALEELRKLKIQIPVIMLSVLTQHGANATFKALELGAIDFIPKPSAQMKMDTKELGEIIIQKLRGYFNGQNAIKKAKQPDSKLISESLTKNKGFQKKRRLEAICIGTSTGGPKALQVVLAGFPKDFPCPVFVVQHMPAGFTKAFAERMDMLSPIEVKEAEQGEVVKAGVVYIAPGDFQMKIAKSSKGKVIELEKSPQVNGHRPAVEVTFDSARVAYGGESLAAVIMTGMGRDGAEAIKRIKEESGYTIAQNEETSVIYGMNRSAVEIGGIDKIVALQDIAGIILEIVKERE